MASDIVFIAPDKKLADNAKQVIKEFNDQIDVHEASLNEAVKIASKVQREGAVIIISRGGSAALIRKHINITVVEIEYSFYDILNVLTKAKTFSNKVGIVGFPNLIKHFERVKNVFPVTMHISKVQDVSEIEDAVRKMAGREDVELVIGGTAVVNIAKKYDLDSMLLETDNETIYQTIQKAKEILQAQIIEKEKAQILQSIIDFAYDGILAIDREGKITVFNHIAEDLMEKKSTDIIGETINNVISNTGLLRVLKSGKAEVGEFQKLGNINIATNRVPIVVNGEIRGVVATFQEVERIQKTEKDIRKKLYLKGHVAKLIFNDIVGSSKVIKSLQIKAKRFALAGSTVLLMGETGTGKEIFAQSIHNHSHRCTGPFVTINCAALPENLLESELFGYVRGAFTGARKEGKFGLFELAHTGTIFLDEISEMSPKIQARFLRVIQEKEVTRIGDDAVIPIDIRVIAASNRDLAKLVEEGNFREDLYYRICVLLLRLPPLRERKDDIHELIQYFIKNKNKELGKRIEKASLEAVKLLRSYSWPGNIRQLENLIEQAVVLCDGSVLEQDHIIDCFQSWGFNKIEPLLEGSNSNIGVLQQSELELIKDALKETRGNRTLAARKLGISVTTLWRKIKKYNLEEI